VTFSNQYANKNIFFSTFFFLLLVEDTLASFSKEKKVIKKSQKSKNQGFLTTGTLVLLLGDRRIRIRTSKLRIREAPKTYESYGSGTMPTGMQKRQMGTYSTHLKRSLMSCHLASQGRLLIKILLSTGFLCNTKQPE
jgi:hypothetical protein